MKRHTDNDSNVLRPSRWKVYVALSIGFVALGVAFLRVDDVPGSRVARRDLGSFMMGSIALAYAYFSSGRYLKLGPEALEVKERFRRSTFTPWSEVAHIGIASFPCTAGGRLSYTVFAGIRLRDDVISARRVGMRSNREACGYDILLGADYGASIEELVKLLNARKRESER